MTARVASCIWLLQADASDESYASNKNTVLDTCAATSSCESDHFSGGWDLPIGDYKHLSGGCL